MGLTSSTLLTGATLAATGGTAKTYTPDGQTVVNGLHLADASVTDFRVRPQITVKTRNPKRNPDGTYTKAKRTVTLYVPELKADGTIATNIRRYESEIDPETSAASELDSRKMFAQILFDSDFESFHTTGSLA